MDVTDREPRAGLPARDPIVLRSERRGLAEIVLREERVVGDLGPDLVPDPTALAQGPEVRVPQKERDLRVGRVLQVGRRKKLANVRERLVAGRVERFPKRRARVPREVRLLGAGRLRFRAPNREGRNEHVGMTGGEDPERGEKEGERDARLHEISW